MVIALPYDERETIDLSQARESGVDQLVSAGIDDLAKFRIVQLLCKKPNINWDAKEYAERLGLRPVERTAVELDELAERSILEKKVDDGLPQYKLTDDRALRRDLSGLLRLAQVPLSRGRILARLAAGSLERVRRETRKNKRERHATLKSIS